MSEGQEDINLALDLITDDLRSSEPVDEKIRVIDGIRSSCADASKAIDRFFITTIQQLKKNRKKVREEITKLRALLKKLTTPPYHLAMFLAFFSEAEKSEAIVQYGNSRRVVTIDSRIDVDSLKAGDEVYLGPELNVILKKCERDILKCGELAHFEQYLESDRLLLNYRDEKIVVDSAHCLKEEELKAGDVIHFDRMSAMAFNKIDNTEQREYLMTDVPDISSEDVGGQDEIREELFDLVVARIIDPEGVAYDLPPSACVMLCGPPGTGKTLLAQYCASTVLKQSGGSGTFAVVKPGEFESMWVGETEAKIRNTFRSLKEASERGPVILFLDEIEAIGRIRGGSSSHHADRFLAALLTELDGFLSLGQVIIISASNRKDLIDPALLERIAADGEFTVNRPSLQGARDIFSIHLRPGLPYSAECSLPEETRQNMIEKAVSRIYSPNGDNHLCELLFRDGTRRVIEARELISGRLIKQICTLARREAFRRKNKGGDPGLCLGDMDRALSRTMERMRTKTLTPGNAREHIYDLPQDIDVVSVNPVAARGLAKEKAYVLLDVA